MSVSDHLNSLHLPAESEEGVDPLSALSKSAIAKKGKQMYVQKRRVEAAVARFRRVRKDA